MYSRQKQERGGGLSIGVAMVVSSERERWKLEQLGTYLPPKVDPLRSEDVSLGAAFVFPFGSRTVASAFDMSTAGAVDAHMSV